MRRVGYWLSEKKRKKLNFDDFREEWRLTGLELVQDYIRSHPTVIVIDPLQSVRKLLNRHISYKLVQDCSVSFQDTYPAVGTPNFVKIETTDKNEILRLMNSAQVEFPIVCKALQGHGSSLSHMMAIIFNEDGLKDVKPPCVAQTFIKHNAKLYKLYVIGDYHFSVERPSLKNFTAGDKTTIFFDSHDVSKATSSSFLNELDDSDLDLLEDLPPCWDTLSALVYSVRSRLGMDLFGIDVIVENDTRRHAVIDINAFPGYDGVSMFFQVLLAHFHKLLGNEKQSQDIMEEVTKTANFIKSCSKGDAGKKQENGSSCNNDSGGTERRQQGELSQSCKKLKLGGSAAQDRGHELEKIDGGCALKTNTSLCCSNLNSEKTEIKTADSNHISQQADQLSNCPV
ncbi:inositol-tetrakisphosphate 1-kinase-like isoform X2 [Ptychodera flava]|uniref:inositol-tetrakisphosphate 1-kinase-like isoform X2 n=1 Tax=Ptychodera flava TaxID=63121 RepID=UPI003969CF53